MNDIKKSNTNKMERMDADHVFQFSCSPGLTCFTQCCQDVTIVLTPYDVLRMKNGLGITADEFLDKYTLILSKEKRLIPLVLLKMGDQDKKCPLVTEKGCSIYEDRPWPCRMFPLDVNDDGTFRIIADRTRCLGLSSSEKWPISEWLIDQGIAIYEQMNDLFAQVTTPLQATDLDIDNPKIYQMTFMALYNLDKFREFVFKSSFLDKFEVDQTTVEKIKRSDIELLKFSFEWVKFGIFGQKTFAVRQRPEATSPSA
ncbi:MAG: YkgJ family cysteine cluster protein [Deltaproteobacteria bacterium]|nr:MAG: YkgJ family cysteine cluster protein [Deltaproteobacteria bacterium]